MVKIDHVALWTADLERSKRFYTTYFFAQAGPKYVNPLKQFESYFLSFEDGVRLELMHMPGILPSSNDASRQTFGFIHIAFNVGSQQLVNERTELLRDSGFAVIGEPRWTGDGYYESVVLDPDGNRIEITI